MIVDFKNAKSTRVAKTRSNTRIHDKNIGVEREKETDKLPGGGPYIPVGNHRRIINKKKKKKVKKLVCKY